MSDTPIPAPAADPRTEHLLLPLPAPNHNGMRTDAARIAASLVLLDQAVEDIEIMALALGD